MTQSLDISIISPIYNEVENIDPFIKSVEETMSTQNWSWELILIDDGSDDGSLEKLKSITTEKTNIRVLALSKNFGQTPAIQAGFDNAYGKFYVTLDSDLQNDPKDIPLIINKLIQEDLDLVVGWRKQRKDNFFMRNLPQ